MELMVVNRFKTYFLYWYKTAGLTLQSLISTRLASLLFLTGKLARFFFFLWFLIILKSRIELISGYNFDQLITFFLVFNFFDLLGQIFFRGIYWFRNDIVSGNFDYKLVKPISPLFQVLTKHTDFLDIPLFVLVTIFLVSRLTTVAITELAIFALLGISSLLLITAIHILVAAVGVITTEVDHSIWIYRDLSLMGRVPVDIYTDFVRALLTFVIPIALIFTIPAKALFGLIAWPIMLIVLIVSLLIYLLTLRFWHYALTQYSSASS